MKLNEVRATNVNKTRSIAGRVIKVLFNELDKAQIEGPADKRRYLHAILQSLEQRGDAIVARELRNKK